MESHIWIDNLLKWQLFNDNCLDFLTYLNNETKVNCIFTSPPYWKKRSYSSKGKNQGNKASYKYSSSGKSMKNEIGFGQSLPQYLDSIEKFFSYSFNVIADEGFIVVVMNKLRRNRKTYDMSHDFIKLSEKAGFFLRDIVIWYKENPRPVPPNSQKYYLDDSWEYILIFSKGSPYFNNRNTFKYQQKYKCKKCSHIELNNTTPNIIKTNLGYTEKNSTKADHPAKFPITLPDKILPLCCKKGDIVCDPFSGTGSTLISCINNEFNFYGCELYNIYYNNTIEEVYNVLKSKTIK